MKERGWDRDALKPALNSDAVVVERATTLCRSGDKGRGAKITLQYWPVLGGREVCFDQIQLLLIRILEKSADAVQNYLEMIGAYKHTSKFKLTSTILFTSTSFQFSQLFSKLFLFHFFILTLEAIFGRLTGGL